MSSLCVLIHFIIKKNSESEKTPSKRHKRKNFQLSRVREWYSILLRRPFREGDEDGDVRAGGDGVRGEDDDAPGDDDDVRLSLDGRH